MELIIKSASFLNEFNSDESDELHASLLIDVGGTELTLYDEVYTLANVKLKDVHDLENFITLCKRAREYGE